VRGGRRSLLDSCALRRVLREPCVLDTFGGSGYPNTRWPVATTAPKSWPDAEVSRVVQLATVVRTLAVAFWIGGMAALDFIDAPVTIAVLASWTLAGRR